MNMYNILIVDDEKIERNGIKLLLKRMGINLGVIEAENGKKLMITLCLMIIRVKGMLTFF